MVGPTNPASQLMQLSQTEFVSAMHDDGIGRWNVDTGFDDRGAEQDVGALRNKIPHDLFQIALMHLPMRDEHSRLRQQCL